MCVRGFIGSSWRCLDTASSTAGLLLPHTDGVPRALVLALGLLRFQSTQDHQIGK